MILVGSIITLLSLRELARASPERQSGPVGTVVAGVSRQARDEAWRRAPLAGYRGTRQHGSATTEVERWHPCGTAALVRRAGGRSAGNRCVGIFLDPTHRGENPQSIPEGALRRAHSEETVPRPEVWTAPFLLFRHHAAQGSSIRMSRDLRDDVRIVEASIAGEIAEPDTLGILSQQKGVDLTSSGTRL